MTPIQVSALEKIHKQDCCYTPWAWKSDFGISQKTLASLLGRGLISGFVTPTNDDSDFNDSFIGSMDVVETAMADYRHEGIRTIAYGTKDSIRLCAKINGSNA